MPTRKQRRRRAKERRHEYEYVYVDEEGREVEVEESDKAAPAKSKNGKGPVRTRSGRKIDPPSWQRVGKRALIFAPLMLVVIRLLESGEPWPASIFRTAFLLLVFLPFSYVMDSFLYRSYQRRTQGKS